MTKPQLNNLNARIRQCELLIRICEEIKQLEKLQDGRLEQKVERLETEQVATYNQIETLAAEIARNESILNSPTTIGTFGRDQLNYNISSARIRMTSLRANATEAANQIETFKAQIQNNSGELAKLYDKLDNLIQEGFDPNSVEETLAALRQEKQNLVESMKADISTRKSNQKNEIAALPTNLSAVRIEQFDELLMKDIFGAGKSIEIVSPKVDVGEARKLVDELAKAAAGGVSVTIYMCPLDEQSPSNQPELQTFIRNLHRMRISVVQRSGIEYDVVIIDNLICWEGAVSILGKREPKNTMSRTVASSHVREMRHFLFYRIQNEGQS